MADFANVSVERGVEGRDGRPGAVLRFPFNQGVIDALKELPTADRYWNGHAWWVAMESEPAAVAILFERWREILFYGVGGESDFVMNSDGVVIEQGGLFD